MRMKLISPNITLMPARKKMLPKRRNPRIGAALQNLALLIHDLHLAHPPTQVQGPGPGKRVQVKGNARQNVSI